MKPLFTLLLSFNLFTLMSCGSATPQQTVNRDNFEDWTSDSALAIRENRIHLNHYIDSLIQCMQGSNQHSRIQAQQRAIEIFPVTIKLWAIDTTSASQIGDKYINILNEWLIESQDGDIVMLKNIVRLDDYFTITVRLDRHSKQCKQISIRLPHDASSDWVYLCFIPNEDFGRSEASTDFGIKNAIKIQLDSLTYSQDEATLIAYADPKIFANFLTNKVLTIDYLDTNYTEKATDRWKSTILRLGLFHSQYQSLP